MNKTIFKDYYHIKGTPTIEEQEQFDSKENYVSVELSYVTGKGYYLDFWKMGRSTWGETHTFDFAEGRHKKYKVIACNRPGSKRAEEALKIVNENLDSLLAEFTKGYEIERENVA